MYINILVRGEELYVNDTKPCPHPGYNLPGNYKKKKKRKKGEKTKTRASKIYEDEYESHQIWGKG